MITPVVFFEGVIAAGLTAFLLAIVFLVCRRPRLLGLCLAPFIPLLWIALHDDGLHDVGVVFAAVMLFSFLALSGVGMLNERVAEALSKPVPPAGRAVEACSGSSVEGDDGAAAKTGDGPARIPFAVEVTGVRGRRTRWLPDGSGWRR